MKKKITIFGSTGSIGISTLDIINDYPEKFEIVGLTADKNYEKLLEQVGRFNPKIVLINNNDSYKKFKDLNNNKNLKVINGNSFHKMRRARVKIVGKPKAWLYDLILEVINKHNQGVSGLDKPIRVSQTLIRRIFEREPKTLSELKDINGMTSDIIKRYGKPLIKAISSAS